MLYSIVTKETAQKFPSASCQGDYWAVPDIGTNFTDLGEKNRWLIDIRLADYSLLYIFAGEEGNKKKWQSELEKIDARLKQAIGSSLFEKDIKWNACVVQDAKIGGRMGCPGPCILYLYLDQHCKFRDLQYFWFFIATLKGLTREEVNKIDRIYNKAVEANQGGLIKEAIVRLYHNLLEEIISQRSFLISKK